MNKKPGLEDSYFDLDFLKDDQESTIAESTSPKGTYKIIIADDDEDVHTVTKLLLKGFCFEEQGLEFIHTYDEDSTKKALTENKHIAIILLDVVMDTKDTGLRVVEFIRNELGNFNTRIILRTGHPGEAPEEKVITDYDVNDYKLKTELTKQKLFTSIYSALRSYRDITLLEKNKTALERIVKVSNKLFSQNSLDDFLSTLLDELEMFYLKYSEPDSHCEHLKPEGFIYEKTGDDYRLITATEKYKHHINKDLSTIEELKDLYIVMKHLHPDNNNMIFLEHGFLFYNKGQRGTRFYFFVETVEGVYDYHIIQLFLNNYALALDNFHLNQLVVRNQEAIIFTLTETIERHSHETSNHVRRVSSMMKELSLLYGLDETETEDIRIASALHDIGKIGIGDAILQKPSRLTVEEFDKIKDHTRIGYNILKNVDYYLFKIAATIAHYHHEKYDGTGYPQGLAGERIPLYGRLMAVVDVFDALVSKRCYKEAWAYEDAMDYLKSQAGTHFDPEIVRIFTDNKRQFIDIVEKNKE
ncbi:response regulator [Tindallia californiensis]|uniref:Stage 0 sporulation protein A homolog n=1 Tax=Tindallia californiensis TaxID=159292 RepID=A0A1H3QT32_9FIRM|nr:response regulator [Tindallia californiensis]SDZ16148.1 Response regulator receiver domain-containing protein [Tindallia californiensis]